MHSFEDMGFDFFWQIWLEMPIQAPSVKSGVKSGKTYPSAENDP